MFLHLDQTSGNTAKHTPPELAVKLPKLVEPAPLPYEAAEKDAATSSLTADATGKHMDQVTNEGTTAGLSAAGDGSVAATTTRPSQQLPDIPDDHTRPVLPPLFARGRSPISPLEQKLARCARMRITEEAAANIPTDSMLESFWHALMQNETTTTSPTVDAEGEMLNYRDFGVATQSLPLIRKLISPSVFAAMPRDALGRVSARLLYRYCAALTNRMRLKVSLLPFDSTGTGVLNEADLDAFVHSQLSSFPTARSLGADFLPYYTFQVTRKFVFFLDPGRRLRIPISRLVDSPLLQEFMNLRNVTLRSSYLDHVLSGSSLLFGKTTRQTPRDSWFHPVRALSVYAGYLKLDADRNGMLSQAEFSGAASGLLSPLFVQRVFEEVQMFPPPGEAETEDGSGGSGSGQEKVSKEMDYKTYVDFLLAYHDMAMPQSIRYFFRFLDMNHIGYIDETVVRMFVADVINVLRNAGHELNPNLLSTMCSEYFDLVRPKVPGKVTVDDLINCRSAAHAIGLLIDGRGLLNYESREGKCLVDPENLGDEYLR